MKKRIIAIILAVVLCAAVLPVGALAADFIEVRMGVNIRIWDNYFQPTDANGNDVPVFIYDGTTYLPIRAMTVMLGASIEWIPQGNLANVTITGNEKLSNPKTTTVKSTWLETIEVSQNIRIFLNNFQWTPKDVNGKAVPILNYNGTTYAPVRAVSEALGFDIVWDEASTTVTITEKISDWDSQVAAVKAELQRVFPLTEELSEYVYGRRSIVGDVILYAPDYYEMINYDDSLKQQVDSLVYELGELYDGITKRCSDYKTSGIRGITLIWIESYINSETDLKTAQRVFEELMYQYNSFIDLKNKATDEALHVYRDRIDEIRRLV